MQEWVSSLVFCLRTMYASSGSDTSLQPLNPVSRFLLDHKLFCASASDCKLQVTAGEAEGMGQLESHFQAQLCSRLGGSGFFFFVTWGSAIDFLSSLVQGCPLHLSVWSAQKDR